MKYVIRVTLDIPVEMPDGFDPTHAKFLFEENGCPGTGAVGAALHQLIEDAELAGICWACNCNGRNEIIHPKEKP